MRLLLLVFLFLNCFDTALYAQSKKKVNEQLFAELAAQKEVNDSLLVVQEKLQNELKIATRDVFNANQYLNIAKERALSKRSILRENYELLALQGYEVSQIISIEEITHLEAPRIDYGLSLTSKVLFRNFPWAKMEDIPSFAGLKVKEQNELLVSQVHTYDSINGINSDVLMRERNYLDTLVLLKNETEKEIKRYNDQVTYMVAKSDAIALKWRELDNLKEEKEEAEYQEKLKAEAKKHKRGELYFIPVKPYRSKGKAPVLSTDETPDQYENVILDDFPVSPPPKPPVIMDVIDESAEFPGGREVMLKYLADNLVLPESVLTGKASGKCYLRFVVSAEGKISNVQVVKGVTDCPECDREAKHVVEKMPDWKPGTNAGKNVNQWFSMPVTFKAPN